MVDPNNRQLRPPIHRSWLRLRLGKLYYGGRRRLLWMSPRFHWAKQRQTERRIVVRMAQCNKFSPHLTISVQATQAGAAYKDRIMDHRPVRKQFAEFLLKKVAHLLISQPFCFLGGEGAGC